MILLARIKATPGLKSPYALITNGTIVVQQYFLYAFVVGVAYECMNHRLNDPCTFHVSLLIFRLPIMNPLVSITTQCFHVDG